MRLLEVCLAQLVRGRDNQRLAASLCVCLISLLDHPDFVEAHLLLHKFPLPPVSGSRRTPATVHLLGVCFLLMGHFSRFSAALVDQGLELIHLLAVKLWGRLHDRLSDAPANFLAHTAFCDAIALAEAAGIGAAAVTRELATLEPRVPLPAAMQSESAATLSSAYVKFARYAAVDTLVRCAATDPPPIHSVHC